MHGLDVVLVARDACALRGMVDDIDEVGIVGLFDGSRNGKAGHAEVADFGGYEGGTDGAVGGHGVGFDVDGGFHGDRCYRTDGTETPPACGHPLSEGDGLAHDAQGLKPLVKVVTPLRG